MIRWKKIALSLGAVTLAVLALVLGWPAIGAAQQTRVPGQVAISQGPGGVWVVHGNQLYICDYDPVRPVHPDRPPTPRCGQPLTLP